MTEITTLTSNQQWTGLDDVLKTKDSSLFIFNTTSQSFKCSINYTTNKYILIIIEKYSSKRETWEFSNKQDLRNHIVKYMDKQGFKEKTNEIDIDQTNTFLNISLDNNFDDFWDGNFNNHQNELKENYIKKLKRNSENYIEKIPEEYIDDTMLMIACDRGYMWDKYKLIKSQKGFDYIWDKIKDQHITWFNHLEVIPDTFKTQKVCLDYVKEMKNFNGIPTNYITKDLCKQIVKEDWLAIETLPKEFIDQELSDIATNENINVFRSIPDEFKTLEMCKKAVKWSTSFLGDVPEKYMTVDFIQYVLRRTLSPILQFIPKERQTKEIQILALSENWNDLWSIPFNKRTIDFCKIAVSNTLESLRFVPEHLYHDIEETVNIYLSTKPFLSELELLQLEKYQNMLHSK